MAVRLGICRDKNGYLLAEWLTGILLCGILFSGFYLGGLVSQRIIAVVESECAAWEFARDILHIRERALAGSDLGYVELRVDRKGYWVCRRPNLVEKKRDFALGRSDPHLWFSSIPSYVIKFSVNGAPSSSGKYILQHKRISAVKIQIDIQPVTGRIRVARMY